MVESIWENEKLRSKIKPKNEKVENLETKLQILRDEADMLSKKLATEMSKNSNGAPMNKISHLKNDYTQIFEMKEMRDVLGEKDC